MKKIASGALVALAATLAAGNAMAEELWNPHLRGINEGLASGALPPEGVYFIDNAYWLSFKHFNGSGKVNLSGTRLDGFVDVPIALWNPGIKVLGADFAVAIAQPFDYTNVSSVTNSGHWGTYNTIVVPGQFSWALPFDLHVKADLAVYIDDASSSPAHPPETRTAAGSGNGFWTLEPGVAVSWLHDGWNLTADAHYDYNFKDNDTHYKSGDQIAIDYTATKNIQKWTIGVGGYTQNQLARDSVGTVSLAGTTRMAVGAGPLVGYNFGPLNVSASYNYGIVTHNDFGGDTYNFRAILPF